MPYSTRLLSLPTNFACIFTSVDHICGYNCNKNSMGFIAGALHGTMWAVAVLVLVVRGQAMPGI